MAALYLQDFFDYKNELMQTICKSPPIVKLLTDDTAAAVPNKALPYTQVFPHEYIPDTVSQGKAFLCFDVDVLSVSGKTFLTPALYVWVFSHKSKLRLPDGGGVRTDKLACEMDRLLSGNRYFGLGELSLYSVSRFSPISDYQGRTLCYNTREWGRTGSKKPPANRKFPG